MREESCLNNKAWNETMVHSRPIALVLIAEGFNEIETFVPYYRFLEIGWEAQLISPQCLESIRGKFGMHFSEFTPIERYPFQQADLLLIPGGRSPRYIVTRHQVDIRPLIFHFLETGKPIAAIGHGPLVLAHAKHAALAHIEITGSRSISDEVHSLVGQFHSEPCTICGNIITARMAKDLPVFIRSIFHVLFERDRNTFPSKHPPVHP